jgi:hypothetical protein
MKPSLLVAVCLLVGCKQGPGAESSASATAAPSAAALPPAAAAPAAMAAPTASTATDAAPVGASAGTASPPVPSGHPEGLWNFDSDQADAPPAGFSFGRTGSGREGRWRVVAASDAPSKPNVLAQLDADSTDYRFPVAVVDASSFKDVKLSVACKPVSGRVDQGCGLVWRFKDAGNYYLTRANALEDNVNLYRVKDGRRVPFAGWNGKVASGVWHKLQVEARGDRFQVSFDDKKVIDAKDTTFAEAGKVGVWTKADSVMQFDDLSAAPL